MSPELAAASTRSAARASARRTSPDDASARTVPARTRLASMSPELVDSFSAGAVTPIASMSPDEAASTTGCVERRCSAWTSPDDASTCTRVPSGTRIS